MNKGQAEKEMFALGSALLFRRIERGTHRPTGDAKRSRVGESGRREPKRTLERDTQPTRKEDHVHAHSHNPR